jgi:hypothetical protein
MYIRKTVADIRQDDTVEAIVRFYEKFKHNPNRDSKGYIISTSKKKAKSTVPYAYVFRAGPVCAGNYSVRIPLPNQLKVFAGTRYGVSKKTGLPNGFEFKGFESKREAADFVKELSTMSIRRFIDFLKAGDGSGKFYHCGFNTSITELDKMYS